MPRLSCGSSYLSNHGVTASLALTMVTTLLIGLCVCPVIAQPESTEEIASDSDIDDLVAKLGSSQFRERERANQQLIEQGAAAIPALSHAIAESSDLEVVERAFAILVLHSEGRFTTTVLDTVEPLLESERPSIRRYATVITNHGRHAIANRLQRLGAKPKRLNFGNITRVDFDESWHGTADDLKDLHRLIDVTTIDCERSSVSDDYVQHFARLPKLQSLYLGRCDVTGTGAKHLVDHPILTYLSLIHLKLNDETYEFLGQMTRLEHLGLDHTGTTDANIAHLANLHELQRLWLTGSKITDDGLAIVENFPKLWQLELGRTKINGSGLQHMKATPEMRKLSFVGVPLEGKSLENLAVLKSLTSLGLDGVPIDDDALAKLKGHDGLQKLWVNGSNVTDASLDTIISMKGLRYLYAEEDQFSNETKVLIKTAIPNCRVHVKAAPDMSPATP